MRANARRGARRLAGAWAVAVVLAAVVSSVVTAGPAQAKPTPFTYSTVAWTHSAVIVASVNTAGDLYYWQEPDGTGNWNQELVATGQYKYSVPSIAWTGSAVVIADSDGGQVNYWYQFAGTRNWHEQQAATSKTVTYGPATIGWTGSAVIIAAVTDSTDGNNTTALNYWYQFADTGTWHHQQVATNVSYSLYAGPSIGWTGSTVTITDSDPSGNLDYWYQFADTGTWHHQQVAPSSSAGGQYPYWHSPVISWTGSAVVIAAVDDEGDLDYWYQPVGTGTWHRQQVAAASVASYDAASIAWTGSSVVLAGVSETGSLNFWWQAAGTSRWHEEPVATLSPGGDYFQPSMAAAGDSVVITDSDSSDDVGGNLDYWWQQDGTAGWNPQQVAAG